MCPVVIPPDSCAGLFARAMWSRGVGHKTTWEYADSAEIDCILTCTNSPASDRFQAGDIIDSVWLIASVGEGRTIRSPNAQRKDSITTYEVPRIRIPSNAAFLDFACSVSSRIDGSEETVHIKDLSRRMLNLGACSGEYE